MTKLLLVTIALFMTNTMTIFDFKTAKETKGWYIINDTVMGGVSSSRFTTNEEGLGVFSGSVSLDNNGGFASLRYDVGKADVSAYSKFMVKLRGDGNKYQFRAKAKNDQSHSHIAYIETNTEWQVYEIPFADMYPTFRGRTLNMENYEGQELVEIGILIGNKKPQDFKLVIEKIWVE